MAADCHSHQHNEQPEHCEHEVEPAIWNACAGTTVQIPAVGSRVYYFPQGHIEHSSDPQSVLSFISHLLPRPFLLCRVLQVLHLVDPDSDEVFTKIRLEPLGERHFLDQRPPSPAVEYSSEEDGVIVSFAKVLTPSDANNGGGFSVPRFCADSIFPPLDYAADPPVQTLSITDLRGNTWNFRHIYRGTPRRHLLTTGWSKYVNSKKLITGDSVVFMKNKVTGKLFLGVRRAKQSISSAELKRWAAMYSMAMAGSAKDGGTTAAAGEGDGQGRLPKKKREKVPPESVAQALELAANNMPFEAVYYPKAGSRDFLVAAKKVDEAMALNWMDGVRVKMAVETEDSSRMTWFEGTVSSLLKPDIATWQRSPWSMLQVAWDEPEVLENMKKVSPWQVESVPPMSPIDVAFSPAKKQRLPQNCGFGTESEADAADYPVSHMSSSDSMTGHLTSSCTSYSIIPAGMQGARQNTYCVSSLPNVITDNTGQLLPTVHAENNQLQRLMILSTDLTIGSSQSVVSPDSSSRLSSPDVTRLISRSAPNMDKTTSVQLFGQTIHINCSVGSPKDAAAGSREYGASKENQGLEDPVDGQEDVPCSVVPIVEAFPLSMDSDGIHPASRN